MAPVSGNGEFKLLSFTTLVRLTEFEEADAASRGISRKLDSAIESFVMYTRRCLAQFSINLIELQQNVRDKNFIKYYFYLWRLINDVHEGYAK